MKKIEIPNSCQDCPFEKEYLFLAHCILYDLCIETKGKPKFCMATEIIVREKLVPCIEESFLPEDE